MENNPEKKESEIEALARIVKAGFDRMDTEFAGVRDEISAGFAAVNKRIDGVQQNLGYRIDQLDQKLDQHRQETKDDFDAMRRVGGGISRTLTDHEERIKALEGE